MKRVFFAGAAVAAASMLAACSGQQAAGDAQSAKLVAAADALQKKVGEPGEKAQMPPADDPDVKAFDAEAQKALVALGTPAMPVMGMDSFDRLCGGATNVMAAYVSAGTGAAGKGAPAMSEQAKAAKMNENATRYMGQILTPLLYAAHCTAVHMPVIDKELATTDLSGKADAVGRVRNGAYGQASGLVQMAASGDIQPGQRKQVIDVLVRDAGAFAIAFTPAQRREIAASVDQAAQASPDVKAQAERIKADIARAPCGKLCSA